MTEKIFKTKIYKPEDFVGKTIKAVYDSESYTYIYFESGEIAIVEAECSYHGEDLRTSIQQGDEYIDQASEYSIDRLLGLGFITNEQYDQLKQEYSEINRKIREEKQRERDMEILKRLVAQYPDELKSIF